MVTVSVGAGVRGCTNAHGGGIHARAHARQRRSRSDGQSVTTALSAKPGLPFRVSCFVRDARICAIKASFLGAAHHRGTARPPSRREDHEAARASESSHSLLFTAVAPAPPHGIDHARSSYFRQLGAAARRCLLTFRRRIRKRGELTEYTHDHAGASRWRPSARLPSPSAVRGDEGQWLDGLVRGRLLVVVPRGCSIDGSLVERASASAACARRPMRNLCGGRPIGLAVADTPGTHRAHNPTSYT